MIKWKVNIVHRHFLNFLNPLALQESLPISFTSIPAEPRGGQLFSGASSHPFSPFWELGQHREGKGSSTSGATFSLSHFAHGCELSWPKPGLRCLFQASLLPHSVAESGKGQWPPSCSPAGPLHTAARVNFIHYKLGCRFLLKPSMLSHCPENKIQTLHRGP